MLKDNSLLGKKLKPKLRIEAFNKIGIVIINLISKTNLI